MPNRLRIGIYGGSFDPIHNAHLLLAEVCREQLALDQVRFIPANQSPLKPATPEAATKAASNKDRLAMLELAIGGHPHFVLDPRELERGGVSYTVDTLEQLSTENPEADLFLLMGADSLRDFPRWRVPKRICELALPIVVDRGGLPPIELHELAPYLSAERLEKVRQNRVAMPQIELSSRELRQRAAHQQSLRFRLPRAVEQYILAQGLYRPEA